MKSGIAFFCYSLILCHTVVTLIDYSHTRKVVSSPFAYTYILL